MAHRIRFALLALGLLLVTGCAWEPVESLSDRLPWIQETQEVFDCDVCPVMVNLPAGQFTMGSPPGEPDREANENPQHDVTIAPLAVGKYEITRAQYTAFVEATGYVSAAGCMIWDGSDFTPDESKDWRDPGFAQNDDHPVVCVSWDDAKAYVEWLSSETGDSYRLLTEAEWEYAARAGTAGLRYWDGTDDDGCQFANWADQTVLGVFPNFDNVPDIPNLVVADCFDGNVYTASVGTYRPNAFELHDVLGNVYEWTEDCWNDSYEDAPVDGSAWFTGECERRHLRGGSWFDRPLYLRSANRFAFGSGAALNSFGIRVAKTLQETLQEE